MAGGYLPGHLVAIAWSAWHEGYDTFEIAEDLYIWRVNEAQVYNTLSLLRSHLFGGAGRAADPRAKRGAARKLSLVK